ncbi:MAG: DUF4043 family protein [Spirochaetia bacterium]|nr:DUF4043 family protein [Spirochaetia bacterium]
MPSGTGKVAYTSDLIRQSWMRQGLLQAASKSFWAPYKGLTKDAIIMQATTSTAEKGHTVVFDMDGSLAGRPVKGNTTAKGTGEQKKRFSDKLTVEDYRYVVDNGTAFDGIESGNLNITQHEDSRVKLGDLWVKSSDQAFFDIGQQTFTHGIDLTTFDIGDMFEIEQVLKKGTGFSTTNGITKRLPLEPYMTVDGEPIWLWVMDIDTKIKFLANSGVQTLLSQADVRGAGNMVIKGKIGKIGSFVFVEAKDFFGDVVGPITTGGYYNYDAVAVQQAGLRQYDTVNHVWTGETGFDVGAVLKSRNLILGAGAFQHGRGKSPDYKWEATDFEKFSESAMEVWCGTKATQLVSETPDYNDRKAAGYSYGGIYVDITHS